MLKTVTFRSILIACLCAISVSAYALADAPRKVDVPAGELTVALRRLAEQSGVEFVYSADQLKGVYTGGVHGEYTAEKAVTKLLEGTKLKLTVHESGALLIAPPASSVSPSATSGGVVGVEPLSGGGEGKGEEKRSWWRLAQADTASEKSENPNSSSKSSSAEEDSSKSQDLPAPEETTKGIPEILVEGSKILNMDIRRTEDDPQPYTIFDRTTIERSGAADVHDFLKYRLTANVVAAAATQDATTFLGNTSNINLRGLGAHQTLILIDGRRTAGLSLGGTPVQPDLNSIPLSAIERIEILPTTASGIYGGGATGGVVNVVLRRDYSGMEMKLTHENTFDTDVGASSIDFSGGANLEGGKTNLLLVGKYSTQNSLANGDRDFVRSARQRILASNPAYFPSLTVLLPAGATPNIRSVNGSNLQLKPALGGTSLNSFFTHVPAGYAGLASDGAAALVARAGTYNLDLAETGQTAAAGGMAGESSTFLIAPTLKSLTATVRREFTPALQAFVEVGGSKSTTETPTSVAFLRAVILPDTAPNNPFTTPIYVQVPDASGDGFAVRSTAEARKAAGGLIARLPRGWTGEIDYTWSWTKLSWWSPPLESATASAAMVAGTLNIMRDLRVFPLNLDQTPGFLTPFQQFTSKPYTTDSRDATLRLSGPFGSLPAGPITLSSLVEYRDDTLRDGNTVSWSTGSAVSRLVPSKSQNVGSIYLETRLPLLKKLEAQLAGRYDRYTTKGATSEVVIGSTTPIVRRTNKVSSTNPTVALSYEPLQDLTLRGSYGTGFLPPGVTQLIPNAPTTSPSNQGNDPLRGNETVVATIITGGNPDLEPEESKSFSLGAILTPRFAPGLRVSLDYTKIDKTNNIIALQSQQAIDNESALPGRIVRGTKLPTDPASWPGRIVSIDRKLANISEAELEAYDLQLDYTLETSRFGSFEFFSNATRTVSYKTQVVPTSPLLENAGYGAGLPSFSNSVISSGPPRFKSSGGLSWSYRPWTLGWNMNYFSSYRNYLTSDSPATQATKVANQGNGTGIVPAQSYHDVFAVYNFDRAGSAGRGRLSSLFDKTEIQLGIRNVFDKKPPFDAANTTYFYSFYGDPRQARYYASFKKGF